MKISNFIFNYLSFPLLPNKNWTIFSLSVILKFKIFHKLFKNYLRICLNKREYEKILFATNKFIFRKKLPLTIYDIYLQALRNLDLKEESIIISRKIIRKFPQSDIGYWHLLHSYIATGDNLSAKKVVVLFKKNKIKSKRFETIPVGNRTLEELFFLSDIDINTNSAYLFFSDSGLIGQSLLKIQIKKNNLGPDNFGLYISSHAGFSNTLVAIINTLGIAKLLNIREIFIKKTTLTASLNLDRLNIKNIKIRTVLSMPKMNLLYGNYFSHFNFVKSQNLAFPKERFEYASLILNNFSNKNNISNDDLVIHIRSGDIFRLRSVHPKYGQPPLSFYKLCISHFKPNSITLIFENFANPVISLLIGYIKSINCDIKINLSNSLEEDVSKILNAKNVVFGNGTFVPGILLGSKVISTIYSFEAEKSLKLTWSLERVNNRFNIVDSDGFYRKSILENNWKASNSQLKLMKNYPIENLKIKSLNLSSN